jgi:hypothetical protein
MVLVHLSVTICNCHRLQMCRCSIKLPAQVVTILSGHLVSSSSKAQVSDGIILSEKHMYYNQLNGTAKFRILQFLTTPTTHYLQKHSLAYWFVFQQLIMIGIFRESKSRPIYWHNACLSSLNSTTILFHMRIYSLWYALVP